MLYVYYYIRRFTIVERIKEFNIATKEIRFITSIIFVNNILL